MRYIADSEGCLKDVSFGGVITCNGTECVSYTGTVPEGYDSLEDWYLGEMETLYRWKIVDGQLTLDESATEPVEYKILTTKEAVDYVVETGSYGILTDGWYYEKWKSGKAVCWGKHNFGSIECSTAWGNMYETQPMSAGFPDGLFIDTPQHLDIALLYGGASSVGVERGSHSDDGTGKLSSSNTGEFYLIRPTAHTFSNATVGFYAIGRWK